jgi:hypothetical protein
MDLSHGRGLYEIKFVKAFFKANTMGMEHGSHRAIGENGFS